MPLTGPHTGLQRCRKWIPDTNTTVPGQILIKNVRGLPPYWASTAVRVRLIETPTADDTELIDAVSTTAVESMAVAMDCGIKGGERGYSVPFAR